VYKKLQDNGEKERKQQPKGDKQQVGAKATGKQGDSGTWRF